MSGKQVPDRMLAHAARAKGTCDDFSVCRAFWSFWAPKGHDITTTKRIYDCRLRVSCIKENKRLFNVLSVLKRYSPYSLQVNLKNQQKRDSVLVSCKGIPKRDGRAKRSQFRTSNSPAKANSHQNEKEKNGRKKSE